MIGMQASAAVMSKSEKKPKIVPSATTGVPAHLREASESLPLFLTMEEAAAALRVHVRTVQRIVADQEMAAMRSKLKGASRVIIPRSEIIRWLAEHSAR